ncbi:MAG: ATP phosphoribosyltransferase [Bacteroidia bacterium]|nr:ATP phosphoribosyltransferase [Bacteroidia bacterium]
MNKLKIAIQKTGRLTDKTVELLKKCGLSFELYKETLTVNCTNFPLELLMLRDDDIPNYVGNGIAQLGICGENLVLEKEADVTVLKRLNFGHCSLTIAVPNNSACKEISNLNGKKIATSYPNILAKFLKKENIKAEVIKICGSAEISPNLGLSDAIFDLVSTGGTLKSNGLKPFYTVLQSEAVLICLPGKENDDIISQLLFRISSVMKAEQNKYVVLNIEKENISKIIELLPGLKSPTVVPLAEEGWVALHSVIPETDFWEKINKLKDAGAQGILVISAEKMII